MTYDAQRNKGTRPRAQVTINRTEAITVLTDMYLLDIAYRTAFFSGNALKCNPPCILVTIFTGLSVIISATDHHICVFQVGYQSGLIFSNVSHSYLLIRHPQ